MRNKNYINKIQLIPFFKKNLHQRIEDYFKWFNDKQISKYLDINTPKTKTAIKKWLLNLIHYQKKEFFYYQIYFGNKCLGHIGIKNINFLKKIAEIGIVIGEKRYWKKGIGTLSLKKLLLKIKKIGLKKIFALVLENNNASINFFKKNNFKKINEKIINGRKYFIYLFEFF